MLTQILLFLYKQSNQSLHRLPKRLINISTDDKTDESCYDLYLRVLSFNLNM